MSDPKPTQFGPNGEAIVPMRLQKFLARAGAASRRGSENLMTAGPRARERGSGNRARQQSGPAVRCGRGRRRSRAPVRFVGHHHAQQAAGYLTTMSDPHGVLAWQALCLPIASLGFSL